MCVACRCIRQVSARTPASLISAASCARLQPPLPVRGRERHGAPLLINLLVGNVKGKEARECVNAGKRRGKKENLNQQCSRFCIELRYFVAGSFTAGQTRRCYVAIWLCCPRKKYF